MPSPNRTRILHIVTLLSCSVLIAALLSFTYADSWQIPSGSKAHFKIKHFLGNVKGSLKFRDSKILFDPLVPERGKMDVTLEVASIKTGIGMRDKHLRKDDFFDAEKYPLISFHSTQVRKTQDSSYSVSGDLTIKDVTKPVEIPFTFSQNGNKGVFKGKFQINRFDYKVGENQKRAGGDIVDILLEVPVETVQ